MALEVVPIWLWLRNRSLGGGYFAPQVFLVPGFATVGAAIAARRGNTVGWLFVGLGLVAALHAVTMVYGERVTLLGPGSLPAGSLAEVVGGWLWPVNYLLLGLISLLFPDGRPPSPRWRPVARLIVGAWCLSIVLNALAPSHDNPLGLQTLRQPALKLLNAVVVTVVVVGLVVMVAAPFVRFRRAGYQQRQQLKVGRLHRAAEHAQRVCWHWPQSCAAGSGHPGGWPWAAGHRAEDPSRGGVAILRHRLYDIDRLINRTLVYGVLTAILGLGYASVMLVLGEVFGGVGAEPPSWAVAAATLAVAALFRPPDAASKRRWIGASTGASTTRPNH